MAVYKHGVYVREQDTSLTTPIEGTAGLQVIYGTAPINMVADPSKAVNEPTIIQSRTRGENYGGQSYSNVADCSEMGCNGTPRRGSVFCYGSI